MRELLREVKAMRRELVAATRAAPAGFANALTRGAQLAVHGT
jgi:hypothetical protein